MARPYLRFLILFVTAAFHKDILPETQVNTLAVAQIFITPSWNETDGNNHGCILKTDFEDQVIVRSNLNQFCSIEVFSPSNETYIFVQFLSDISMGYFPVLGRATRTTRRM